MYIFLDIDGVLNSKKQWITNYALDDECIKNFCAFVRDVNGKIILASSWRKGWAGRNNPGNLPQINNLEKKLAKEGCGIYGKTESLPGNNRDKEILQYLEKYPNEQYIIVDDDISEFSKESSKTITSRIYLTDPENGFSKNDITAAKRKCLL